MLIDLNADLGESFGVALGPRSGTDGEHHLRQRRLWVSRRRPSVLRQTVALAAANGVAVGAHPGTDLVGFGRREMQVSPSEVEDLVLYQVAAVAGVAAASGTRLQHVKAGALYNMAVRDRGLANAIARATAAIDRTLILFGLPGSELIKAGQDAGLRVAAEAFADRMRTGRHLTSRRRQRDPRTGGRRRSRGGDGFNRASHCDRRIPA